MSTNKNTKLPTWGLLFAVFALVGLVAAAACSDSGVTQADLDAVQSQLTAAQADAASADAEIAAAKAEADAAKAAAAESAAMEPEVQTIVQVGTSVEPTEAEKKVYEGWASEWSEETGVFLLQQFDSSGPDLWDASEHPLVYFASEGPGYGGLQNSTVTLPGYQAIDGYTHEILASPHFNIGEPALGDNDQMDNPAEEAVYFEPHGLGVSGDGKWIYIPTAIGASFGGSNTDGRVLIVNARTGKLDKVLQVRSRPHHIKHFVDSEGNDRVLIYSWNTGAYILDPNDDNRVVGGVNDNVFQGRGYLAFVDHSGRWLFYTARPPRGVESQGTVAIIDTTDWSYVRNIGIHDSSPIFVAFDAMGKFAYVTGGHESTVAKIDMSAEDPGDWELVKFARAGTEGPYGLNLNWEEDLIVTIGKGEGSHNKGITVGLVDPRMIGSARPNGEVYTGCLRADHGIIHPDPEMNELWISCNASFETVIFDLSQDETRQSFGPEDYIKARIASPNGGSSHNGAFVEYAADWSGRVLADQNGLHGTALETQRAMLVEAALAN